MLAPLQRVFTRVDPRGCRAWRALAKEWMGAVAGFKSLRGVQRWKDLRAAIALQLLSNDPSLQQASLKCLKVQMCPFFPNRFDTV